MTGKTNESGRPREPNATVLALEVRLTALERQMAERSQAHDPAGADKPPSWRAELLEELDRHRNQLRDYEKALVERIADVDDDRRATASRLQRAWQTQREEIDERLRRYARLSSGVLLLLVAIFSAVLFVIHRQAARGEAQVTTEVSTQPGRLSEEGTVDQQARQELGRLTAELADIKSALNTLNRGGERVMQAPAATRGTTRPPTEDRFAVQIRLLGEEQRRLVQELASLRSAVETSESKAAGEPGVSGDRLPDSAGRTIAPAPANGLAATAKAASEPESPVDEGGEDLPLAEGGEKSSVERKPDVGPTTKTSDTLESGSGQTLIAAGDIYGLQLIGFFNRKSLDEFVARKVLPARVYILLETYQGRPWYALIYSLYEDYAAAEDALSRLPADLVALKPWIRPLSERTELQIVQTRQEPD
jgi:DamX protein